MPRSSRRPAPARPASKPSAQQTRPAATYAPARPTSSTPAATPHPPPNAAAPNAAAPGASQGPGLFGQMASTAAGVAVGSSIGHAVGSFFTGGGSSEAPAAAPPADQPEQKTMSNQSFGNCQAAFNMFSSCMEQNGNDGNACQWYFQQLKACQEAQSQ